MILLGSHALLIVAQASKLMDNAFMVINAEFHALSTRQHASVVIKFILGKPKDTVRLECRIILEIYGR